MSTEFTLVKSSNPDVERAHLNKVLRRLRELASSGEGIQAGTATGQLSRWNNTTGRYEPVTLNTLPDAIDDAAAAGLGVAVGGLYRTGSILKARIA